MSRKNPPALISQSSGNVRWSQGLCVADWHRNNYSLLFFLGVRLDIACLDFPEKCNKIVKVALQHTVHEAVVDFIVPPCTRNIARASHRDQELQTVFADDMSTKGFYPFYQTFGGVYELYAKPAWNVPDDFADNLD